MKMWIIDYIHSMECLYLKTFMLWPLRQLVIDFLKNPGLKGGFIQTLQTPLPMPLDGSHTYKGE